MKLTYDCFDDDDVGPQVIDAHTELWRYSWMIYTHMYTESKHNEWYHSNAQATTMHRDYFNNQNWKWQNNVYENVTVKFHNVIV